MKLHLNVPLSETMCRIFELAAKTQCQVKLQGHGVYPSICIRSIYPDPLGGFLI